jgi:uncharacterized protein YdeI (YjbR/CyaY-like superfamily)
MWEKETEKLRKILLDCGLIEEKKWSKPCFVFEEKNIVVIQPFKAYFALLFFKGYLLDDPDGILVLTGKNTKVGRQIRFTDLREIGQMEKSIKAYVFQAIEVERAGIKPAKRETKLVLIEELQQRLNKNVALKKAFNALTPGRQRGYNFYFSQAKLAATRESRIEKNVQRILAGKGLND